MPPQTARDLVVHRTYAKPDGSTGLTRKTTATQEWVFGATGGHEFMIKFDKNFVKKHLFLYSKKTAEVAAIAAQLWEAAGKPPNRDEEFWLAAELAALDAKLTKVLKARGEKSVCTCGHLETVHLCSGVVGAVCSHARSRHLTGTGNPCACKEPPLGSCACTGVGVAFTCRSAGCTCGGFTDTTGRYSASRVTSGKGDNPLAGAGTTVNTCLVLDRISMDHFKQVVVSAIGTAETPGFTWVADGTYVPGGGVYHGPGKKSVVWDFGPSHLGCVINADLSQPPAAWGRKQGVKVAMVKTGGTPTGRGGNQYQYYVFHLEGDV